MKLIVGLGNPGEKYKNNRHNVGHMVIDALLRGDLPNGVVAKKTTVFMNESGKEIKKLIDFYKISLDDLYIVHDDLDIPLGEYKIQRGKGPKLHYGIQSIENTLGIKDFWRVRVGIEARDRDKDRVSGEQYVLEDFTEEEKKVILQVTDKVVQDLETILNK